jgi:hypothetical protein
VNERYTQKAQHGAIGDGRKYGSNNGSRENMYENGYDSNNLFGGFNSMSNNSLSNDSLSNALNNSVNSTGAHFNSKMHDNHYRINSEPVFQGSYNFGNDNTGNSLFNTRVSQSDDFIQVPSFDRNYAPASLDYKKVSPKASPTNLWPTNPFFGQQTDSDSNNFEIREQKNNFGVRLSRQTSENSKNSSKNSSTHFSPTNGDQSFNFQNSNINRTI